MASTLKVQNIAHTGGTNAIAIDSGGFSFDKRPHFIAKTNQAQSIPASTYTQMQIHVSVADTHSFIDLSNNRINFSSDTAGTYLCIVSQKLNNLTSNRFMVAARYSNTQNGNDYIAYFEENRAESSYSQATYTFLYTFTASNVLAVDYYQDGSGAVNTYTATAAALNGFISGFKIG